MLLPNDNLEQQFPKMPNAQQAVCLHFAQHTWRNGGEKCGFEV
jgi:hypothetical protein